MIALETFHHHRVFASVVQRFDQPWIEPFLTAASRKIIARERGRNVDGGHSNLRSIIIVRTSDR